MPRTLRYLRRAVAERLTCAGRPAAIIAAASVSLLICPAASARAPARLTGSIVQTTFDLRDALTPKPRVPFATRPARGARIIVVDDSVHEQRILGFGGAMTDTSAWLLERELGASQRRQAMNDLFGASGIRLDYVRIPMAASDFTVTGVPYSYDDLPPGQSDPALAHFSIAHDVAYIVPALRTMLALDPSIVTFANPWSAPPWMKANGTFDDLGGSGYVFPADYPILAQYFVKFIQAYQAAGIPIQNITPMNEPFSRARFPATNFLSAEAPYVTGDLVPALAGAGLHTRIWALDSAGLPAAQQLMGSAAAPAFAGIAFHCYGGMGDLSAVHAQYPSEPIIVNECSPGIMPYSAAEVVIDATDNWASAVQLWNLALDPRGGPVQPPNSGCHGCTGIVTISEQTHALTLNRNYYEFGQASRYIDRGAVRIQSTRLASDFTLPSAYGVTPGVDDAAFLNPDGSKVLLAYNSAPHAETVAIAWHGRYLSYTIPSRATDTIIWR